MESPSTLSLSRLHKEWLISPLFLMAGAFVAFVIYLQVAWPGNWVSRAKPLTWNGSEFTLSKGVGQSTQGKLKIDAVAEQGVAVASLVTPLFWAQDYATMHWALSEIPPGVSMSLLWRTAEKPDRVFTRPLVITKNGLQPLQLIRNEEWQGQIMGLALMMKGDLSKPITVETVSLAPTSGWAALSNILRSWFQPEGWQITSINFLDGDALDQEVAFVPATALAVALGLILYLLAAKLTKRPARVAVAWVIVFLGWFALDARWQWNLLRQLDATRQQYAGKTWEGKHLAAEDGVLFDFVRQAKAKLPSSPVRILYFSDDAYSRGKGSYYLYPHNVMSANAMPAAGSFKPGDHIAVFAKKDVKYDLLNQTLIWSDTQTLRAELLLSGTGFLLLKVR